MIYADMMDKAIAPELGSESDVSQDVLAAKIDRFEVALDEVSALGSLMSFRRLKLQ